MTRTIDSEFTVNGTIIAPDFELYRPATVSPADIANPNHDFSEFTDPEDSYNYMRVYGTYLDGEFVHERLTNARTPLPQPDNIVKNHRYVCLTDLRTEHEIYITEDRFAALFETILIV